MSIKMNSKSLLAVFLVGSLCGLNIQADEKKLDDEVVLVDGQVEGAEYRLQITGATNQILAAIDDLSDDITGQGLGALATSAQAVAIEGATFDTTTDSLEAISNKIGSPLVATAASTLALVLGDPTASTASASMSAALGAMEGTGFIAGASLMANAQRTAANQVVTIANSAALNGTALTWNGIGTWATVYAAITAAVTLPTTQAEITDITAAITALGTVNVPTTGYTAAQINLIVLQLQAAVTNWDALIS